MGGTRTYNIATSHGPAFFDVDYGGHIQKVDPDIVKSRGYYDNYGTKVEINYNRDRGIYEARIDGEFPNFKIEFKSKSDVFQYIRKKRDEGVSYQKIANYLNKKDVATPSGRGKWHGSSVGRLLKRGGFRTGSLYDTGKYPSVISRIHDLKEQGYSDRGIAKVFNSEGVSTLSGRGRWHGASVGRLLKRHSVHERTQKEKVRSFFMKDEDTGYDFKQGRSERIEKRQQRVDHSSSSHPIDQDRIDALRQQAKKIQEIKDKPKQDTQDNDIPYQFKSRSERRGSHRTSESSSSQPVDQARIDFLRQQAKKLLGK